MQWIPSRGAFTCSHEKLGKTPHPIRKDSSAKSQILFYGRSYKQLIPTRGAFTCNHKNLGCKKPSIFATLILEWHSRTFKKGHNAHAIRFTATYGISSTAFYILLVCFGRACTRTLQVLFNIFDVQRFKFREFNDCKWTCLSVVLIACTIYDTSNVISPTLLGMDVFKKSIITYEYIHYHQERNKTPCNTWRLGCHESRGSVKRIKIS